MIEYDKSSPLGRAAALAEAAHRKGPKVGELLCDKIMAQRYLQIANFYFSCPYCRKSWDRGGHKEGFVKCAAGRHVFGCYEIALFDAGYVRGDYTDQGHIAEPFDLENDFHVKVARSIKGLKRSRATVDSGAKNV